MSELIGCYEYSVGRGANLLLNVGPDSRGLIPEADAARLIEFGNEIRRRYDYPLPFTDVAKEESGMWSIKSKEMQNGWNPAQLGTYEVDTCVIEEDITDGEAVEEFRVYAKLPCYGKRYCVYIGQTIGHKAICRFPIIKTGELSIEIKKSDGEAKLKSMKAYCVADKK